MEEVEVVEPAAGSVDGATVVVDTAVVETVDVTEEVDTEDSQTGSIHCRFF